MRPTPRPIVAARTVHPHPFVGDGLRAVWRLLRAVWRLLDWTWNVALLNPAVVLVLLVLLAAIGCLTDPAGGAP